MLATNDEQALQENPYKQDFPLLAQHKELAFLDSAATAQRPLEAINAQSEFYQSMNANPLRGLYKLSVMATEAIETTRAHVARFIGAVDANGEGRAHEVVFTRNATESLNLIAQSLGTMCLEPGDEVVISIMEHHSNMIPWQQICKRMHAKLTYLYLDDTCSISDEELERKITNKTKIVSLTHVSNVLGITNDIARIAALAHKVGAYMVVDAAQSAPHMQLDVQQLNCDLLAFSAHKALGPFGIGVMWGKLDILERMPVFLTGGEMIDSVTTSSATWAQVPEKFEAGTQDAAGIYAFDKALSYFDTHDMKKLERREAHLSAYLYSRLSELSFIDIYGAHDPARHRGVVSFNVNGVHPHDVSSILDSYNVCIRAGHHCAQPLLNSLGVQSTCRASIAFYNDAHDIDCLIDALQVVHDIFKH